MRPRPLPIALAGLLALGFIAPPASGARAASAKPIDWPTYGFDLARSGFNPLESAIGPNTAPNLGLKWSRDLGAVMIAQPVEAANVAVNGARMSIVYVGTEHGDFYALRAGDGSTVWHRYLGSEQTNCTDMPDGVFGIGGAAAIDRPDGRLYVAGGNGRVYALALGTGRNVRGWPMTDVFDPTIDHVYGGLAFEPASRQLYVTTASHCDEGVYHGRIADIDVDTRTIPRTFRPSGKQPGGGIWGPGGVSIDTATDHVFVATGNALTVPESYRYSDAVVELTHGFRVIGSDGPGYDGGDVDFGATPILYRAKGCPAMVAAKNKAGVLLTYERGAVSNGPRQQLQMGDANDWQSNGIPAYWPSGRTLYVSNSSDSSSGTYLHGMVALRVGTGCKLHLRWQQTTGPNASSVSPPTVAGGVVFYGDGAGNTERAFDAKTGHPLWDSGSIITGGVYAAPTVVNGRVYVASWDDSLYSFGL